MAAAGMVDDAESAAPPTVDSATFDWTTWDLLPFNDSRPEGDPPDAKRGKWGGPCAGPGKEGTGCHARWASVWYGKKGESQFCKESACHKQWERERDAMRAEKAEAGLTQADRLRQERKGKRERGEAELGMGRPNVAQMAAAPATPGTPALATPVQSGTWDPVQIECFTGQRCVRLASMACMSVFLHVHAVAHERTNSFRHAVQVEGAQHHAAMAETQP